jgi:nitrite reductase/ring-hydroxylating ferredoxin subunit
MSEGRSGQKTRVELTPVDTDRVRITVDDRIVTVPAECPHRRGRLVYAHVNPRTFKITCPLHRSTFDLETGDQTYGPVCGGIDVEAGR